MFGKHHQLSLKDAANSSDESVFHPLPTLFRLLGLNPFKKVVVGPVLLIFLCYFPQTSFFFIIVGIFSWQVFLNVDFHHFLIFRQS